MIDQLPRSASVVALRDSEFPNRDGIPDVHRAR
jgi:hypothetical protein